MYKAISLYHNVLSVRTLFNVLEKKEYNAKEYCLNNQKYGGEIHPSLPTFLEMITAA